jgi:hypothetical protein
MSVKQVHTVRYSRRMDTDWVEVSKRLAVYGGMLAFCAAVWYLVISAIIHLIR